MPASSSERSRWRKRKREAQIARKPKPQEEDEDEEDDEEEQQQQQQEAEIEEDLREQQLQQNGSDPNPGGIARESEVLLEGGVRICDFPAVVKHPVNRPHSSILLIVGLEKAVLAGEAKGQHQSGSGGGGGVLLENVSHGQLQALSTVPVDSPALGAGDPESSACVIKPLAILEGLGVVKQFGGGRVHVVPMHADWFSPSTVHRLERQVVPHFFSGKSVDHTAEKYMECRNCIVAKYMENPEKRLVVADCQGLIMGIELDDMTRIVRFLDHWGIINYCATGSVHNSQSNGLCLIEDSNGDVHVPAAALKSIDSLIQFDKPRCRLKAADVYSQLRCHADEDSELERRIRERLSENRCNICLRPLPPLHYQSLKEVDVQLCSDCFHDGRFVIGHSSLDFLRVDSTRDYGDLEGENWTDQETLLLLEGMEVYKENWNEIAEHVGTKSKAQCILHFIRLPMDDAQVEKIEVPSMSISSNLSNRDDIGSMHSMSNADSAGCSLEDPCSDNRFPFANSGNPVMSLVAFLASVVGPRVAAACAHESLATLSEDNGLSSSGSSNRANLESMLVREEISNSSLHKDDTPLSAEKVTAAAKFGLAAAAMKAKLFADHEEREVQRLSANIINHQLKRLELKLKQFAEVETLLMKECEQVDRARQRIASDRATMLSTQFGSSGVSRPISVPGISPAVVNNNIGNNRQQVVSGSPSQPFIHGYGTIHPMSILQQQQQPMYGLGPRLPLSAIHPPSSASPNAMLNAATNSQPTIIHSMLRPVSGAKSGLG